MVNSVSQLPSVEDITSHGNLIVNAFAFPNDGCEDEVGRLILNVKKHSDSDKEPGCLQYTVVRSYTTEGGKDWIVVFAVWEIYTSHEAFLQHTQSEEFKTFRAAADKLVRAPSDIKFFYEATDKTV
ncbi:hypothetical protein Clacol_004526 [Clathrus columnatus]|uniref:ABM domain-containing protein n=1 Tax=Clathrus columnatus TaxID=1419009 RepID=A0AAV5AED4_9AGAM|nr:hypothetical protein Clacol_004526 [Clathrus columnatus]